MMKSGGVKILIAALAVLLVAGLALSQTVRRAHMGHEFGFEGRMLGFMTDYLDLTDAQQAQVKQIIANEKPTVAPLMKQLADSHRQLRQLEQSGTFDEAKVRALASQQAQTMTELIVQKARIKSEIFNVLTPEQKSKAIKFMDRREARFQKHMHGMQEDTPPPPPE